MIVLKTLLSQLARPEVTEVVLQGGKPPSLRIGGQIETATERPVSGDELVQLLFSAGGSRYVESLSAKPTQWRTRIEGVGAVVVTATQHGDTIEAHFALRDAPPVASPPPRTRASTVPPPRGPKTVRPPRADAAAPGSKRKPGARAPEPAVETPRVPAFESSALAARSVEPAPSRREWPEAPSPFPPPVKRGELPTLPSDIEIDLDVDADDIPRPTPFDDVIGAAHAAASDARSPSPAPRARVGIAPDTGPASRAATVELAAAQEAGPRTPTVELEAAPPRRSTAARMSAITAPALHTNMARLTETAEGSLRPPPAASAAPSLAPKRGDAFRTLLQAAREAGGSDLHLIAGRPPLLRIAGQLVPHGEPLDPRLVEDMMRPRIPPRLTATFERDGSCDFALEEPELGRFRVNVSRQRTGLKATMRLIAAEIPTLAALGLPDAIAAATHHHQGLIVISGPTGHGKTTTLAALLDTMNRETKRHIITVEDPIEYVHPQKQALMSQREVGTHTRSFQAALKASLREDPDVIVIGELRDTETVRAAIAASETGHLVIGTMNTPSAAKTIDRLIDLFPPADQQQVRMTLAGGLRLVVSQRLLPDVGGRRMVAAVEVLPGVVPLWNLIRDGRTYQIPSLQQRGKGFGVIRLDDSLAELVRAGRVTAAAAVAVADAPEDLEAALGMRRNSQTGQRAVTPPAVPPPSPSGSGGRPTDGRATDPTRGFFERAGALFGGSGKKGT
ncbi:Twitching motility protein PilT [Minicystis rosea]|nr:Twitching motility protein PilT [Minicystis rosea]